VPTRSGSRQYSVGFASLSPGSSSARPPTHRGWVTFKRALVGQFYAGVDKEVTEEVDYRPGQLFRRRIIRPVYASAGHACTPRVAVLPARVIPGAQVGTGLIAHVLLSKYVDAIPLYRQEAMLARLGPAFTRQAMGQWVEHAAGLLRPVCQELQGIVGQAGYVQGDETPHRVLDPARPGAAREAWLWTFLAPGPGVVVFDFQLTRSHEPALAFLRNYRGVFQTDGFTGYDKALRLLPGDVRAGIVHAHCMAHCRRGFVAALEAGDERAAPFLAYLGALYQIEAELREAPPEERAKARASRSLNWLLPMEVAMKNAAPYSLPEKWNAAWAYSQPCTQVKVSPSAMVSTRPQINPLRLFCKSA